MVATTVMTPGETVALIGCGTMGAGIAQVAACAGHTVLLYDQRAGAARHAVEKLNDTFHALAGKGKLTSEQVRHARECLVAIDDLQALSPAALIIEAIREDLDIKRKLFAELETIVAPDCILASNTSSLSITAIGAALKQPQRLIGMHFFNPAPQMRLVEVVHGLATSSSVATTVAATATAWGKVAVHVKSSPGFIVNRIARPYYAEAFRLLQEGAADCATLDAILRDCGGFRMGPCELTDLIGHDVNYAVTCSVFEAFYFDPRFMPSHIQRELVQGGLHGRKNGRGFFDYTADAAPSPPKELTRQRKPAQITFPETRKNEPLLQRLRASTRCQHMLSEARDDLLFECDGASVYFSDGRSATERAQTNGRPHTLLIDLVDDATHAKRLAICAADICAQSAIDAVTGALQAAGFAVCQIDDIPGMVVLRTVAMLINEAADTLYHGVASAEAIDQAMQLGANYPRGPLAWADRLGIERVCAVLANLQSAYGEDRYRISPLLKRQCAARSRFHE